jgi:hypothetical protein
MAQSRQGGVLHLARGHTPLGVTRSQSALENGGVHCHAPRRMGLDEMSSQCISVRHV